MIRLLTAAAVLSLVGGLAAARAEDAWMFDPAFREGNPADVLVEGHPPLLRGQLDAVVDLVEAAFELALPASTEQGLRDACENAWMKATEEERQAFVGLVAPLAGLRQKARTGDRAAVIVGLQAFRRDVDERLGRAPDAPPHPELRDVLHRRREVAWPGTPPVHRLAADAWMELVVFLASVGRNEAIVPTAGQWGGVRRDAGEALHGKDAALRGRLRDVHRTWLRLKSKWDDANAADRLALRWRVVELLNRALPEDRRPTVESGGDLVAYARTAATLSRTQSAFEAWSNLVRHPAPILETVDAWLGPLPEGGDEILLWR